MKAFDYFIQHYKLTFVILLTGLSLGTVELMELRREPRPPVDFARVTVTTNHPGASSEEIEEFITNKLEQKLKNIAGIRSSHSISAPNLSRIRIRLDLDNVNTQKTLDEIYRAVQDVPDLPADLLEPPHVHHEKASEIPILSVAVIGSNQHRKRNSIAHELKSLLENRPHVSNINLQGFNKREFQVLLNPQKVRQQDISLQEVVRAVQKHSQNITAGAIRSKTENSFVRVLGKIQKAEDLEDIVIRSNFAGQQVFLKDIATTRDSEEDQNTAVIVNGHPAVVLQITKKEKTDSIKTIQQIKKIIAEYEKTISQDIKIRILFDESETSKKRLKIVTNNAIAGLILVLIVLLICLPGWLGAVAALSLPFSMLSTIALVSTMDITFNVITMCAFIICIGMLVDNAIVISENYVQFRQRGFAPRRAARESVYELAKPVFATTITTVFAFLPMLLTKGVMGQFIRWIPIVVSMALIISLIESFFLLPCRLSFTVSSKRKKIQSELFTRIRKKFEIFILKTIERKYLSAGLILCILLVSFYVSYAGNRFILFPKEYIETYRASFEVKKGTPLPEFNKKTLELEKQIHSLLKKENIVYTFSSINSSNGQGTLFMEIQEEKAKTWDHKNILKKLTSLDHTGFTKLRFEALRGGPPVGRPVELILFSQNTLQLNKAAQEIHQKLTSIKGLVSIENNREYSGPEYIVYPDGPTLSRMGLNTQIVGSTLRTALNGSIAGELTQNGENFYIRVKYNDEGRSKPEWLKQVSIPAPTGQLISLNEIVKWNRNEQGAEIKKHYLFKPALTFYADVDPNITTSVSANGQIQKIMKDISVKYPSLSYKLAGEQETVKESLNSLFKAMILLLFMIFSVLLVLFNSFSISLLILSNVLLGLIGISWSFLLHSKPLSFFAMIGTVGLAGVVINSSIILVSCIEKMRKKNPDKSLPEVLSESAGSRLRPIFITTVTTVLGLFPTAYGLGGFDSVLNPITLALTWGLISGTLLTLIWTPCGYIIIHDLFRFINNKKHNRS